MSILDFIQNATSSSSYDMAIDLGTANTLVGITGQGIVINEPSVVAIERSTHRVLAVGHEAKNMINHTPDTFSAEHPLHDGVIADYDVTEAMISAFINKAAPRRYPWQPKPRIVVCIPCGATSVEKRAVFEASTLKTVYDLTDMTICNTVRFDHAVGLFHCHTFYPFKNHTVKAF